MRESNGNFAGLKDEYVRDIIILAAIARLDRWETANRFLQEQELEGYVNQE